MIISEEYGYIVAGFGRSRSLVSRVLLISNQLWSTILPNLWYIETFIRAMGHLSAGLPFPLL